MKAIEEANQPVVSNIERLLLETGVKQGFIAMKSGIAEKSFSDMMNGRMIIRPSDVVNIALAFSVNPSELFREGGEAIE